MQSIGCIFPLPNTMLFCFVPFVLLHTPTEAIKVVRKDFRHILEDLRDYNLNLTDDGDT